MTAPTTVTDDELSMVRATAASIAGRCRTAAPDHGGCWAALRDAGLTELRLADDAGRPLGTSAMASAVVEELAGAVCGAPLVGHLLATELIRLAAADVPDGPLTVVLDARWRGPADRGTAVDAALAERGVTLDEHGTVALCPLGAVVDGIDPTRPTRFTGEGAAQLGTLTADSRVAFDAFARTLLAADALGAASAIFDSAVAYAKDRVQFGVPVGSFQAVQHLCAQAHVHLEAIRSALLYATRALDGGDPSARTRTSLVVKAYTGDAAVEVVQTAVQVFGGIAITVEHPAHRHLRRVLVDRDVLGDADALTDLLLEEIDA